MEHGDIERVLAQTPAPKVLEGSHRQRLKQQLLTLHQAEGAYVLRPRWRPALVWACRAAVSLAAVGVAAWAGARWVRSAGELPYAMITLPDGAVLFSNDPNYGEETALRHHSEIKALIAEGKRELVGTMPLEEGNSACIYKFVLSEGQIAFCAQAVASPEEEDEKAVMWVRVLPMR